MKKAKQIKRSEKGFTLIEVIVTIVIAAILGSFLITFMSSVPKSVNPVIQTQNLAVVQTVMEKIVADYESYIRTIPIDPIAWANIGSVSGTSYVTNGVTISTDITLDVILPKPVTAFPVKEITVTAGDQKLVSYFME